MRLLAIKTTSTESAESLRGALEGFGAEVVEPEAGPPLVRIEIKGLSDEIVALLNAIHEYVTSRSVGPTWIELDGRSYLMEASAAR